MTPVAFAYKYTLLYSHRPPDQTVGKYKTKGASAPQFYFVSVGFQYDFFRIVLVRISYVPEANIPAGFKRNYTIKKPQMQAVVQVIA